MLNQAGRLSSKATAVQQKKKTATQAFSSAARCVRLTAALCRLPSFARSALRSRRRADLPLPMVSPSCCCQPAGWCRRPWGLGGGRAALRSGRASAAAAATRGAGAGRRALGSAARCIRVTPMARRALSEHGVLRATLLRAGGVVATAVAAGLWRLLRGRVCIQKASMYRGSCSLQCSPKEPGGQRSGGTVGGRPVQRCTACRLSRPSKCIRSLAAVLPLHGARLAQEAATYRLYTRQAQMLQRLAHVH